MTEPFDPIAKIMEKEPLDNGCNHQGEWYQDEDPSDGTMYTACAVCHETLDGDEEQ